MVKDVHTEHCCVVHGCAYYVSFCPVALKLKNQSFPCPFCLGVMPELPFKISEPLLREDIWDQLTGIDRLVTTIVFRWLFSVNKFVATVQHYY